MFHTVYYVEKQASVCSPVATRNRHTDYMKVGHIIIITSLKVAKCLVFQLSLYGFKWKF